MRITLGLYVSAAVMLASVAALAATGAPTSPAASGQAPPQAARATPLAALQTEAARANPAVAAARATYEAARQVPSQVSTLPDPQAEVRQFSVGNPLPFAGYSTSNFAYLGVGIKQDFPYPGKLRLRGEVARGEAAASGQRVEVARRNLSARVAGDYYDLAATRAILGALGAQGALLREAEQSAAARYASGAGPIGDVLRAQLAATALLRRRERARERRDSLEADLKAALNRPLDSADVIPEPLAESPAPGSASSLEARLAASDPELAAERDALAARAAAVALAKKNFSPDFSLGYMYQRTGNSFPDYYMVTFGLSLPLHRRGRLEPALAQAISTQAAARRGLEAATLRAKLAVRQDLLRAQADARILAIYRGGSLPQARAAFSAGLDAYQHDRADFASVLRSFTEILDLNEEYWRTLADHETALAQIRALTGGAAAVGALGATPPAETTAKAGKAQP